MAQAIQTHLPPPSSCENDVLGRVFEGYRFSVCKDAEAAARALDVRREVYVAGKGYGVPVPDAYDCRSWILAAEHVASGRIVGTMRLTPRFAGPFECEEYFSVPQNLRASDCIELNRFAILPAFRKGTTFLPVVSLGLFRLVQHVLSQTNARHMVIASRAQQLWTYSWLRFESTGIVANYGSLADAEHELLFCDYSRYAGAMQGHPFAEFLLESQHPEVIVPTMLPRLDIAAELPPADRWPIAVGQ
jgi:hypothetical protein